MSERVTVSLEQILRDGEPGTSTSIDSAFARPFRVLIEDGRDVGRLNHVFLTQANHSYVFGTFCNAPSGRLLYFPGLLGRTIAWDSSSSKITHAGILDHITLEPEFENWHLTVFINGKKDTNRLPDRNVLKVKSGLHYWFGLSIQKPELLERAVERYSFSFEVPHEDADRYSKIIQKSKDGAIFHDLLPPEDKLGENEFFHFDVLIDQRFLKEFRSLPINLTWVPTKPPALTSQIDISPTFPIRAHRVNLPGFNGDILILVSKHVGKLVDQVIVNSAA